MTDYNRYAKLGNYKSNEDKYQNSYKGKNLTIIVKSEWQKNKWVTDYFIEPVRIKCKNVNAPYSPIELYEDPNHNKSWIKEVYKLEKYDEVTPFRVKKILERNYPKTCKTFTYQ